MAATTIHRLTLDPMGKCSNAFFSETTNMIKAKLSNVKLSPAVAAIFNFISEQKNVEFVEDHPMNIHVQFGFNRKVLYKLYIFYADRKSKMATTVIHRLTLDPMGKCSNAFF
jgi:hypothetical protein